jgi:hypothetical protein
MDNTDPTNLEQSSLDASIAQWRTAVLRGRSVDDQDADELESHLREQISDLEASGLSTDEAFPIAVRRLGKVDELTAEFAREHGDRMWKQLVTPRADEGSRLSIATMLGFALLAGVLVQVARIVATNSAYGTGAAVFGDQVAPWFPRNFGFFVLPVLAAYFAVVRRMPRTPAIALVAIVAALALVVNLYPFELGAATDLLVWLHLPIALWFIVGAAYANGDVLSPTKRMDVIRFTGEWAIYYALIALGGAVFLVLTTLVLMQVAPTAVTNAVAWGLPSAVAGAVVVAAWLVEAKKSIIENLAPVLTAIFTPLFAVMLVVAAVGYSIAGLQNFNRELLAVFDVLLLVVLALVVYGISARSSRTAGAMDVIRLIAVVAAIVLDILVLISMFARVGDLGFTANRVAALGLNIVLLVNLVGTAWFTGRLLAGRGPASQLERWQTGYLPVFAAWVLVVIVVLPPVFAFS